MSAGKKILVPTDFSKDSLEALHYASKIAKKIDGQVYILHVLETYDFNAVLEKNLGVEQEAIIKQAIERKLMDFKNDNSNLWGLKIHSIFKKGKIHKEIQNTAGEIGADLIIMGTHGTSGLGGFEKFLLGSNAYRTVNSSPCPVITVREPQKKVEIKNIILPLDISRTTTQKVDLAIEWAKEFNSEIHVLYVVEFLDEFKKDLNIVHREIDEVAQKIEEAGITCHTALKRNRDVAGGVLDYASNNNADLIIIMTRKESLFNEWILGSHSRKVIGQSRIPVLSARPKSVEKTPAAETTEGEATV